MQKNKIKYIIETSKEGLPTIAIYINNTKKIYLHSRFNPLQELKINKFNPDKCDLLIVLGIGLGYHLIPVKELVGKYNKIFLIDIIDTLESEIDKIKETRFLLHHERIQLITGKSIDSILLLLSREIDFNTIKGIQVIEHPASNRIFKDYYGDIKKSIQHLINKKVSDKATQKAFGLRYIRNIIKNINQLNNCSPVSSLMNRFSEYPSLIISSGPSLESHLDFLSETQGRCFLIAVDSALSVLQKNNISPDIFISIDPQPHICEHMTGIQTEALPVFSISSYHQLVNKYPGYLSLNSHPFAQLLEYLFPGEIGSIDSSTGSVAGDAISLAYQLGFKTFGLIGYDFSFPRFEIYSRGTAYQKRYSQYFQNRFSTVETSNLNYIMKSCNAFQYEKKYTRKSFIQYKESIESFIKKKGIDSIFTLPDEGISLINVPHMDYKQYLNTYCSANLNKSKIIKTLTYEVKSSRKKISLTKVKKLLENKKYLDEILNASNSAITKNNYSQLQSLINRIGKTNI